MKTILPLLILYVVGSPCAAQSTTAEIGSLTGRVTIAPNDAPLANATVGIDGTTLFAHTDSLGRYFIARVPAGTQLARARLIGYLAADQKVTIVGGRIATAEFRLSQPITKLDTQSVKADNWMHKPERLMNTTKYDEFYERKTMGMGGYQWTHEDLEKRTNASLTEALSAVPGIRIQRYGTGYFLKLPPPCQEKNMAVFVDNMQVYPIGGSRQSAGGALNILNEMDIAQVEAIEFYKSITGMPARARGDACAAMFIWTR